MSFLNPPKGWDGAKKSKVRAAAKEAIRKRARHALMNSIDRDAERFTAKRLAQGKKAHMWYHNF